MHQFAKLRWGVFEEHGYRNDEKYPIFVPIDDDMTVPNLCVTSTDEIKVEVSLFSLTLCKTNRHIAIWFTKHFPLFENFNNPTLLTQAF